MTLYEYIEKNFDKNEPIFLSELPGESAEKKRREVRKLIKEGKLLRLYNGVYYQNYTSVFGIQGKASVFRLIEKKFLNPNGVAEGYYTGQTLANDYGFTTQNPSVLQIASNKATTKMRKMEIDGVRFVIYKPVVEVNEKNVSALRFLDIVSMIDGYIEFTGVTLERKLRDFVQRNQVDFDQVKACLPYYPDREYRILYELGYMKELV